MPKLTASKQKMSSDQPSRWKTISYSQIIIWSIVAAVVGLLALTPIYLLVRTVEAGDKALDLFLQSRNLAIWGRTVLLSASVTLGTILIAVPLAWLIGYTDLPGRRIWGILAPLPLVMPSYIYAYLFIATFGPKGTVQRFLAPLGIESLPDLHGFWGAFFVLTFISYPYTYLSVRAGLQKIDPSLLEAGRSLGLSAREVMWQILLPQLRPSIIAGSLLVALYTLRDFGAVTLLRYSTFTRAIYVQYQSFFSRHLAAALALQLVAITAVVLYLEWQTRGRAQYKRLSIGVARKPKRFQLGRGRYWALFFVASLSGFALLIPVSSLIYWLVRGLQQDTGVRAIAGRANVIEIWGLWESAFNSLLASGLAAVLTLIAAIPVAIVIVRSRSRFRQALESFTYFGFALPGLVIALAMIFFGTQYALPLYQTLPLMLMAYVILFIPQAIGTVRASLLQVSPSIEEAGRSLGERPSGVLRHITIPLVSPGILAGGSLVFLTCMKELPVTLLLSPTGYSTLAADVWTNINEAFFAQAALPTLLLLLLSSVPLALLGNKN